MALGPNARNAILWVVIAILSYFCLEMTLDWKPLGFSIGELTAPLRYVGAAVFIILLLVAAIRGCRVVWAERNSD
jgi:hypothetical protein